MPYMSPTIERAAGRSFAETLASGLARHGQAAEEAAQQLAKDAAAKLEEQGTTVTKAHAADLVAEARNNPNASPEEIAKSVDPAAFEKKAVEGPTPADVSPEPAKEDTGLAGSLKEATDQATKDAEPTSPMAPSPEDSGASSGMPDASGTTGEPPTPGEPTKGLSPMTKYALGGAAATAAALPGDKETQPTGTAAPKNGMAPSVMEATKLAGKQGTTSSSMAGSTPKDAYADAQVATRAAALPKAPNIQSIVDKYEKEIEGSRNEEVRKLAPQFKNLSDLEATYRAEAKAARSDIERRELAENMGNALAQIGAGITGMKTGIDMVSGLQFSKTDWNKRYEQALEELRTNLSDLKEKRQALTSTQLEAERAAERRGERGMGLEARGKEAEYAEKSRAAEAASSRGFQLQLEKLKEKSAQALESARDSTKEAIAKGKIDSKQAGVVNEATNNWTNAFLTAQTSEDKEEKKKAIDEMTKYEATINTTLNDGGAFMRDQKKKLQDVPLFSWKSSYLEEQAPQTSQAIRQKVGAGAPKPSAPAPRTFNDAQLTAYFIQNKDKIESKEKARQYLEQSGMKYVP